MARSPERRISVFYRRFASTVLTAAWLTWGAGCWQEVPYVEEGESASQPEVNSSNTFASTEPDEPAAEDVAPFLPPAGEEEMAIVQEEEVEPTYQVTPIPLADDEEPEPIDHDLYADDLMDEEVMASAEPPPFDVAPVEDEQPIEDFPPTDMPDVSVDDDGPRPVFDDDLLDDMADIAPEDATPPDTTSPIEEPRDEFRMPTERRPASSTRRTVWLLGSKLSLAILARRHGADEEMTSLWWQEADALAMRLGVPLRRQQDYESTPSGHQDLDVLLSVGREVGSALSEKYGPDHAALFEAALKSNLFLVLYGPDEPLVETIASAVQSAAERGKLPPRLWQPVLERLLQHPDFAEIKRQLFQLYEDVDEYLADETARNVTSP